MSTGSGRKLDVPRSPAQTARFDGEIMQLFASRESLIETFYETPDAHTIH